MNIITLYECSFCHKRYENYEEAKACESAGRPKPLLKVGTIVTLGGGFGWFDGDSKWVANYKKIGPMNSPGPNGDAFQVRTRGKCPSGNDNCHGSCCNYIFYYKLIKIEIDGHNLIYHFKTKAMKSGYSEEKFNTQYLREGTLPCSLLIIKDKNIKRKLR